MSRELQQFEMIPHTADIKIRVFGKTREELFSNALFGMFKSIEPIEAEPRQEVARAVSVTAANSELLLVAFLSECLYLSDVYNEAYERAEIKSLTDTSIEAVIHGFSVSGFNVTEIKAVTHHDLTLVRKGDGTWEGTLVFDI